LLSGPAAFQRDQRVEAEYISREVKRLARQYALPILCASAVTRPPVKNGKAERITMHALRRGEQLVHDADVILLLHREAGAQETELEVAKGRDTGVGTTKLVFWPAYVRFEDASAE
jgi:replicative DNA helicase